MAYPVGEIRTTGNDNNGGYYVTGYSPSTDYTQQNTPAASFTDLATSGAGATTITTATGGVPLDAAGNYIHITGGTNFTAGFYLITSVTNANTFVVSSSPTPSAAGSGGIGAIGGALASAGMAANGPANAIHWVKSGTYNISNANYNTSGGPCAPANTRGMVFRGYNVTRGDNPTSPANMPNFVYTATTTGTVMFNGGIVLVANVVVDCGSVSGTRGFSALQDPTPAGHTLVFQCLVKNAGSYAFYGVSSATQPAAIACAAVNCYGGFAFYNCIDCYAEKCTYAGWGSCQSVTNCVYYGNGAASGDGFYNCWNCVDCTAVGAAGSGFRGGGAGALGFTFVNCLAVTNGAYGFNFDSSSCVLVNCAGYNNTSGNYGGATVDGNQVAVYNFQALTANPFASATDFSPNNTAGGGAGLRGADNVGAIPVPGFGLASGTTFKRDIGAGQHVETGGGTTVVWPQLIKILGRMDELTEDR